MTVTRVPATTPEATDGLDLTTNTPIDRRLCLALSGDLTLPLQCRLKLGHVTRHDWQIEPDVLTQRHAERLREEQDTPSDRLPVRVPGAALAEAQEVWEAEDGTSEPGEAARPLASAFPRPLLGRWIC